jgi:hypothetical protein
MDYVVAGHIGLAAVVDKVDVVMIAVHKVVEREADHIDFVVVRNKEIEGREKTFVQVVAVPACCILTVPEGKVMMVPVKLERKATEVVLAIQDVEESAARLVLEDLGDMDWQPGRDRADRRCSLRLTSYSREACVAVKKMWLHAQARLNSVLSGQRGGLLEAKIKVGTGKMLANA